MAKVTGVVASQLQKDADLSGGEFNSRPYYRIFLGLICSLPPSDPTDGNAFGLVAAIANTLALVQVRPACICPPAGLTATTLLHLLSLRGCQGYQWRLGPSVSWQTRLRVLMCPSHPLWHCMYT